MNLSHNLQLLRKRDKITQEELADRLGVSRQSVSKWETGEAYPETDKLISICDLFGISLDALLRSDLSASEAATAEGSAPFDGKVFVAHINKFSLAMAVGVFLILFGVAACVAFSGFSLTLEEKYATITAAIGGVVVLIFVAAAVFLFVLFGMNYDRFRKENPSMSAVYGEEQIKSFSKKFSLSMALLVSSVLADVIFLVVFILLINEGIILAARPDAACCYIISVFLFVLSFIVGMLVYYGIQHMKYNISEYNKQASAELNTSRRSKLKETLCGAVMMLATALYLVLGFVCGWWHPGWVIFPVGGIICGIVSALMGAMDE